MSLVFNLVDANNQIFDLLLISQTHLLQICAFFLEIMILFGKLLVVLLQLKYFLSILLKRNGNSLN